MEVNEEEGGRCQQANPDTRTKTLNLITKPLHCTPPRPWLITINAYSDASRDASLLFQFKTMPL